MLADAWMGINRSRQFWIGAAGVQLWLSGVAKLALIRIRNGRNLERILMF
jgi:hypothetical protein